MSTFSSDKKPFCNFINILWPFIFSLIFASGVRAEESLCARVKIEISQSAVMERQAFDARLKITNGLNHISLENIKVIINFTDEAGRMVRASSDPAITDALFFLKLDSMENITAIDGTGTVAPSSSAEIHWLIIPAPNSSNGIASGTMYFVGATLTYNIGGEQNITEVSPDYIFVKPMPMLTLDYFIPSEVYGDDQFTPEVEAWILVVLFWLQVVNSIIFSMCYRMESTCSITGGHVTGYRCLYF